MLAQPLGNSSLFCLTKGESEPSFCDEKWYLYLSFLKTALFPYEIAHSFFLLLILLKAVMMIFSAIESDIGRRDVSWRGDSVSEWSYSYCTLHRCCFWRSPWEPLRSSVWEKANLSLLLFILISNCVWDPTFCSPFFQFGLIFVCFPLSQI